MIKPFEFFYSDVSVAHPPLGEQHRIVALVTHAWRCAMG